jgi:pimeloyl-ACP methyl ester carboxylesterase
VWLPAALLATVVSACSNSGSAASRPPTEQRPVAYKTVGVDGLSIFYREAGPTDAPVLLLLHGFPSSSRMFDPLFARLSDRFHLIAPDLPGFGHSDWPDPAKFAYTFDHLARLCWTGGGRCMRRLGWATPRPRWRWGGRSSRPAERRVTNRRMAESIRRASDYALSLAVVVACGCENRQP